MFWKLEFTDRTLTWIDLPMANYRRAWAIYQDLRSHLAGIDTTMIELEPTLHPIARHHYQAIASLTLPTFDPDDLTSRSRWEFFIGSVDGQTLSGFEQLLGLSIAATDERPSPPACTTGDPALDVEVDLLLVFKEQAIDLMNRHSLSDLDRMLRQANDRQDPDAQKRHVQAQDKAKFESDAAKVALRAHYQRKGIPLPDDF